MTKLSKHSGFSGASGLSSHGGVSGFAGLSGSSASAFAPINNSLPLILGTPIVGSTLTATNGSWSASPSPTFTYQWKADGVNITGATSATYVVDAADVGADITVTVTATNSEGSASATSDPVVGTAASTASAYLLETGDALLLESGDRMLLEAA